MSQGAEGRQYPVVQAEPGSVSGWGDVPSSSASAWGGINPGWVKAESTEGWDKGYVQPHRWTTDSPINWELDDSDDKIINEDTSAQITEASNCPCVQQKTTAEFAKEAQDYTKTAVDHLLQSPEYLRYTTRCQLCWCVWSDQQSSSQCEECGGFSMQRPCVVCKGKCGAVWDRDVEMSHSEHRAIWHGECRLPDEEKAGYMHLLLSPYVDEEGVLEALEDLNTG